MNSTAIAPAALAFNEDGIPFSTKFCDIYHPRAGALAQADHVFIGGNDLPQRWRGRENFVILETGFGLGNNFLATWRAWRNDAQRSSRLFFISIEKHPLLRTDLKAAHRGSASADAERDPGMRDLKRRDPEMRDPQMQEMAEALCDAWPPLTPDLHLMSFDEGRVQLMLALGDVQAWLPELVASVDAFYLDGFSPASNPRMWDERVCKALGRLASPDATLATWSAAHALRDRLVTAGFEVRIGQGQGGKRDITLARFAPAFMPRRAVARERVIDKPRGEQNALIIGSGLAGCASAFVLAEQGWTSTIIDRRPQIAAEASGNPAGLFHGIVNAQDGVHARFNRAAAFLAHKVVQGAIDRHGVRGNARGLLRLETSLDQTQMLAILESLGLPDDYIQALSPDQASARSGIDLAHRAWFYPTGGWVDPAGLARAFVADAAHRVDVRSNIEVHSLRRIDSTWHALDAKGCTIAESDTVILANAGDALRLLGHPDWPIESVRGQLSNFESSRFKLRLPRVPIAGSGYLMPDVDGRTIFGATAQPGDVDPHVRRSDHVHNLAQLARLAAADSETILAIDPDDLQGRTAWRFSSQDRLPVIGAVPDLDAVRAAQLAGSKRIASRFDQPRFVPRLPGLFVFTALGSRGITWSALGARVLASLVTGAPAPMEASLLDAIDPARFVSRQIRRAEAG